MNIKPGYASTHWEIIDNNDGAPDMYSHPNTISCLVKTDAGYMLGLSDFDTAYAFVKSCAKPGDTISIKITGTFKED